MAICKSSLSGICTQYIYRTQSRVVCAKPRRFSFFCVVIHQMVADCIVRQRIRGHSDMPPLRKQECGRVKARLTVRQKKLVPRCTGAARTYGLFYVEKKAYSCFGLLYALDAFSCSPFPYVRCGAVAMQSSPKWVRYLKQGTKLL